jgi:hypothetical protein
MGYAFLLDFSYYFFARFLTSLKKHSFFLGVGGTGENAGTLTHYTICVNVKRNKVKKYR